MGEQKSTVPPDYWPCACVKRDKNGKMKAIKCHAPQVKRCRVCKCDKPTDLWERFRAQKQ